jgi:hypothetical protein
MPHSFKAYPKHPAVAYLIRLPQAERMGRRRQGGRGRHPHVRSRVQRPRNATEKQHEMLQQAVRSSLENHVGKTVERAGMGCRGGGGLFNTAQVTLGLFSDLKPNLNVKVGELNKISYLCGGPCPICNCPLQFPLCGTRQQNGHRAIRPKQAAPSAQEIAHRATGEHGASHPRPRLQPGPLHRLARRIVAGRRPRSVAVCSARQSHRCGCGASPS